MDIEHAQIDPVRPTPTPLSARARKKLRERVRVSRACDRCKRRKVKCTGLKPCNLCIQSSVPCTYEATYGRGRLPSVGAAPGLEALADIAEDVTEPIDDTTGSADQTTTAPRTEIMTQSLNRHMESINSSSIPAPATAAPNVPNSSRVSPEPSQTDLQGHYVGPASGVSFLLRVQKRLHKAITFSQSSSIFTFGDAPLPENDDSFCLLIPRDEAEALLKRYFEFAIPTHRFLHRPTAETWLNEFYLTSGQMIKGSDNAHVRRAALFMIFAVAREYMADSQLSEHDEASVRYFLAADSQLAKERGASCLTSVQARLMQCFYLLAQSRTNHCWNLFGTTARLALAIGLNRSRRAEQFSTANPIETECRRRTFWCAYSLDNYLSAALGRPKIFHDDDIDQDLPSVIEDDQLRHDTVLPRMNQGQSIMLASVAHVKIARILSMILRELYSIRPISSTTRMALADKCFDELKQWRQPLAHFLNAEGIDTALLLPIYQRQRNVLNFAYWHAVILTHRPFLLRNFANLQYQGSSSKPKVEDSVQECLKAAMSIVKTLDDMFQTSQVFRAFWFTCYFSFSAVVVLYVYTIQQRLAPAEKYRRYFDAAVKCHAQISQIGEQSSLPQRYCLVLDELRMEAERQITQHGSTRFQHSGVSTAPVGNSSLSEPNRMGIEDPGSTLIDGNTAAPVVNGFADWNESPSSSLADITSWEIFDSMVTTTGFGDLEALFNEKALQI